MALMMSAGRLNATAFPAFARVKHGCDGDDGSASKRSARSEKGALDTSKEI